MSGRNTPNRPNAPTPTPTPPDQEKCYSVMKMDNKGWQVSETVDGEYKDVITVTNTRLTLSERFNLFIGRLPIADVVVGIIRDQLQGNIIKDIIRSLIISFLSKWIDFNDDGTINIKGATSMTGNVTVTNSLNVNGTAQFTKDVNFEEDTIFNGKADFTSELNSSGMVDFAGQVAFNNDVNFDGQVSMQKDMEVDGKVVLKDNVRIGGNIRTRGSITALGGIIETSNDKDVEEPTPEQQNPPPPQ